MPGNTTVNKKSFKLGGFVNVGLLSRSDAFDLMLGATRSWAHRAPKDFRDTIESGLNGAQRKGITPKIPLDIYEDTMSEVRNGTSDTKTRAAAGTEKAQTNGEARDSEEPLIPVYADKVLTRSDLLTLLDPEPLIDNVLDQSTTALLYGSWGTLKTFIALGWAASVATGISWQGRGTQQCRTLYVVAEGAFGFKVRVDAWEIGWQTKISDEWLNILPIPVNLTNHSDVNNLSAFIDWGAYSFVILDTLARCMVGADGNSAKDGGIVVDAMTRLLARTPGGRGVILGVHHAGKDGKTMRGSSAFESGVDTVYFTSRDEQVVSMTRTKRKDGPEHDHHLLELDPIEGTKSCVIQASHGMSHEGETPFEIADRTANLRLIMSHHFGLTGATGTQLRQLAVDDGSMTRPTYYRALSELLKSGLLTNTGSDARPFYVMAD